MTSSVLVSALLDEVPLILAGHGYDFRGLPAQGGGGDDGDGEIGMAVMVLALVLAAFTAGLLIRVSSNSTRARLRSLAPKALVVVITVAPLLVWTASSDEDDADDEALIVERVESGLTGSPEFLISLTEDDINTLTATDGNRTVRVRCVGRDGSIVLDSSQEWPFLLEPGYDYAHAHQPATREQLQRIDRCRLVGPRIPLEAGVKGAFAR